MTEPKPQLEFDSKLEPSRLLLGEQGKLKSLVSGGRNWGGHLGHTRDTPLPPDLLYPTLPGGGGSMEYPELPRSAPGEEQSVLVLHVGGGGGGDQCCSHAGAFHEFLLLPESPRSWLGWLMAGMSPWGW